MPRETPFRLRPLVGGCRGYEVNHKLKYAHAHARAKRARTRAYLQASSIIYNLL
nr:MAG TPA: hypothetical protein [Microviridae sp.]